MRNLGITHKMALLAAVVLIAGSCKKEIIPPPGSTSPVFTADGTFGGEAIALHAGDDNVVMVTESTQSNGVDFYTGSLGNSKMKIEMGIFAGNVDYENPPMPDFGGIGELSFASLPTYPLYKVVKDSFPNRDLISEIQWKVNGVLKGINVLEITEPGKYQVCANITFNDYTQATVCNEVIVGFKSNADFQLDFFVGQDQSFKSWVKSYESQVQSIQWFKDGTALSNGSQLNIVLDSGSHTIRAEVLFANGVKRSKTVLIDGNLTGKNIHDFTKPGLAPISLWDYTAKVKVTKDGVQYFSHNTPNSSNKIVVNNIEYYGLNGEGDPVYILNGTIDVDTKSNAGAVLPLHLNVSFGFAVE